MGAEHFQKIFAQFLRKVGAMLIAAAAGGSNPLSFTLNGITYTILFGGAAGPSQAYVAHPLGEALASAGLATIVMETGEPAADNWSAVRYSPWFVPRYPMSPF
jgi:hypothetical protein